MPLPPRASEGAPGHGFACGYIDESPRKEVKRVTAPPRFVSHGMLPRPRSLLTQGDGKPPSWGKRLEALRYVPPLLRLVYQTHRGYTVAILALRAIRSFVPLAVLWIGKLIIDGVIGAAGRALGARPWTGGTSAGSWRSSSGSPSAARGWRGSPPSSRVCWATCSRTASAYA